jgi:hypothetical protein
MDLPDWHYYEAHVTIAPISHLSTATKEVEAICTRRDFRLAKLLMATGVPSVNDAFMTARDDSLVVLTRKMYDLLHDLREKGFIIRRYKVESTILDSRHDDSEFVL